MEPAHIAMTLYVRYDWQVIGPNTHRSVIPISHLCVLTHIAWKLQVIYECSVYQTIALLLETLLEWFRVAWEIRLESYGRRCASVVLWYNKCTLPVFLYNDFSVAGSSCVFNPGLFLYFLQAHLYLYIIFTEIFNIHTMRVSTHKWLTRKTL